VVTALEELPVEIPKWEIDLVARRLRTIADTPQPRGTDGGRDGAT
jgi:hypothetical protein